MANEFLPGVDVTLQDGGLILPEDVTTESLLIIAPSVVANAPTEPTLVRTSKDLIDLGFGDYIVQTISGQKTNVLAMEWKAAQDAGNRRTYLCALQSDSLEERFKELQILLFDTMADFAIDHVVVKGLYSDVEATTLTADDYVGTMFEGILTENTPGIVRRGQILQGVPVNAITITTATNDGLVFTIAGTDKTVTLPAGVYDNTTKTTADLVAALNVELAKLTGITLKAVLEDDNRITLVGTIEYTLKSGTAATVLGFGGVVGKTSALDEHVNGNIIRGNFAKLLGDYAQEQTLSNGSTLTYIGVQPPSDTSMRGVKAYVDNLYKNVKNDFSPYVSVVAQEIAIGFPILNTTYWTNAATHYASLISTLRPESAPTNKALKGVKGIKYNYSTRQLNMLTEKHFVTFNLKNGSLLVVDGKTTAPRIRYGNSWIESNYTQISTLRITQAAIDVVRAACEPFIGEPNQMPQYNALNASIKGALEAMRSTGAIQEYAFTVNAVASTLDSAKVTLTIVPMFELRRISVDVSLRPPTLV